MKGIAYDSRKVEEGFAFVAIPGLKLDGASFIPEAVKKGAKLIVSENDFDCPPGVKKQIVPSARKALAELANEFYDFPSRKLVLIGITGTNGKTTTAYLIESILKAAGYKVRNLGTVDTPTGLTTPESLDLQNYLAQCVKDGVTHVVMEVSSHALAQERVHGCDFDIAIFTNITHDHLDFHRTMDEYVKAKQKLFAGLKNNGVAIVNSDDPASKNMIDVCNAEIMTYGVREARHELRDIKHNEFDARVKNIDMNFDKMQLSIDSTSIRTPLVGLYNVYNILAGFNCGLALKVNRRIIKLGIESLKLVPGRFERIDLGQPFRIVIDFAHSPDALRKLLELVKTFTSPARGGASKKIILVFGCPGDRDREKRPIMGRIAMGLADHVILTTDDPHSEDPTKIINEIEEGFLQNPKSETLNSKQIQNSNYQKIINREEAIQKALSMAKKDDFVVIAGRGHEKYQDFNGKKVALDDRAVVRECWSRF